MTTPATNIPDKQTLKEVFAPFTGRSVKVMVTAYACKQFSADNVRVLDTSVLPSAASCIRAAARKLNLCAVFVAAGATRDMSDPNCLTVEVDKDTNQVWRISKLILGRDTVLDEIDLSIGDDDLVLNKKIDVKQPLQLKRK